VAEVMTVLGPMSAKKLGATVPHEHALIDMTSIAEAYLVSCVNNSFYMS